MVTICWQQSFGKGIFYMKTPIKHSICMIFGVEILLKITLAEDEKDTFSITNGFWKHALKTAFWSHLQEFLHFLENVFKKSQNAFKTDDF